MDYTRKDATVEGVAQNMKDRISRLGLLDEGREHGVMFVIDERPPVGDNTAVMLHLLNEAAVKGNVPSAYFSPGELSNILVVNRLIAINTGIGIQTINDCTLSRDEWEKLDAELPKLMGRPLYVDDTPEITLVSLKEKITGLAKEKGVRLVVVNPVDKINIHSDQESFDRQKRIDFITADLKALAEDLGITIIAVAE